MLDYEGLLYVEELASAEDNSIKNKLWNLFEAPESGNCARLVSLISAMVFIGRILSIRLKPRTDILKTCRKSLRLSHQQRFFVLKHCHHSKKIGTVPDDSGYNFSMNNY